jgi:hypothetical protein
MLLVTIRNLKLPRKKILYAYSFYTIEEYLSQSGTPDGGTVVEVLCYKSEGRWFDSRWCHWNFSLT